MAHWVSAWGQAHTYLKFMSPSYKNYTARMTVISNLSGIKLRVRISNSEGREPLVIKESAVCVNANAEVKLLYNGQAELTVPAGQEYCSDAVGMEVTSGDMLTVTIAFIGAAMSGNATGEAVLCARGNLVETSQFEPWHRIMAACYFNMAQPMPAVSSIEVYTRNEAGALVCFGDSITQQGNWTRPLADMLLCEMPEQISVINKGIGGNRLLYGATSRMYPMFGKSGIERFDRDVLQEAGARAVLLAIGTNDLGMGKGEDRPEWATAEDLRKAYLELAGKAKEKGLRVYAATIIPRGGDKDFSMEKEEQRIRFNKWIRQTDVFDGIFDFDEAIRDGKHPEIMNMSFDSGDHLHPGTAGGRKMALCVRNGLIRYW